MPPKRDKQAWDKLNREVEQSQSRQSIMTGGLPGQAQRRLADILADKRAPFSANLSVNEFLTSRSTGCRQVAQVSGSSMFHLGWQTLPYDSSRELDVITEAQSSLRTLAVSRIQQEARLLNADGIIGVTRHNSEYDWGAGLLQFTLVGTAIRLPGETRNPHPFVSTLSGQEFWSLYQNGYFPVGYGYGNSVYYQVATPSTRSAMGEEQQYEFGPSNTTWISQELTDFSEAVDQARDLAQMRLMLDLNKLQADGIVDVDFQRKIRFYERKAIGRAGGTDMSVSIEMTGTAIAKRGDVPPPQIDYRVWLA